MNRRALVLGLLSDLGFEVGNLKLHCCIIRTAVAGTEMSKILIGGHVRIQSFRAARSKTARKRQGSVDYLEKLRGKERSKTRFARFWRI